MALGWLTSSDGGLDVVEKAYALERLARQLGALVDVLVMELAPHMGPASDLDDRVAVEAAVAGIAIGLQEALERLKMRSRPLALAIGRVAEQHHRRRTVAGRAVVAHVHPQPAGPGLAMARRQHRHRRVVGMQLAGREGLLRQGLIQRLQQRADASHPARQGRAIELYALAGVDLALR